jgi:D-arabinose 1-dehydrogenase-like Zn-dependent alcohol dehydrogenase
VPGELCPVDGAPLMCAGVTTFNCLRNSGARPGDLVAVLGIGGLGHLAVQYAAKMGCRVVAIARGKAEEPLARKLGAQYHIDNKTQDPAAELKKLGGAKVVLATVTAAEAMKQALGGLAVHGRMMLIGAVTSLEVNPLQMLLGNQSATGWYSGMSIDSEDTLNFSVQSGVKPMNEAFPLDRVQEAYDHMLSGKARFRVVLNISE